MGLFHLAELFGMTIRESANDGSDFSNPSADYRRLFLGEDGNLYNKDSAGTVTAMTGSSGSVATDAIWDAAGDLAVGTGANTAAKLTLGANNTFLKSNGSTAVWASAPDPAGFTTIVKSADQDVTNASNTDDSELQFSVTASKLYMTDLFLMLSGNDTTGDFAFRYAVAAGTMSGRSAMVLNDASLAVATSSFAANAAANTGSITIGTPADLTFPTIVSLRWAFLASNTTTFKLQFGNAAASAGRTSRVMAGSVLRYKQTN